MFELLFTISNAEALDNHRITSHHIGHVSVAFLVDLTKQRLIQSLIHILNACAVISSPLKG